MRTATTSLLVLAGLLTLPILAVLRLDWDWRWAGVYALVLNGATYWTYAVDERRAGANGWRVAEWHLHLLEALGGWPGAFLAQRRLRHKCSKASYQTVFWLIVLAYQVVAIDSLREWRIARAVLERVTSAHEADKMHRWR